VLGADSTLTTPVDREGSCGQTSAIEGSVHSSILNSKLHMFHHRSHLSLSMVSVMFILVSLVHSEGCNRFEKDKNVNSMELLFLFIMEHIIDKQVLPHA
jgi:hypothetical protein